ncbi:VOC family protein [Actinocatenispora sera]|uniref:VOC family protein n=1 Tax=Actinocatenispora sera TaxID=390989 RepID=UPI0033E5D61A
MAIRPIQPCLWFDGQAEQAARLYTSVFPDSRVLGVTRVPEAAPGETGSVMTVEFELNGQRFVALNGGPEFPFTEAVSFQVLCETQDEIDRYWAALTDGGKEGPCGWAYDRFGLAWQIVPQVLPKLLEHPDQTVANRVTAAFMGMNKLDIAALERAASNEV